MVGMAVFLAVDCRADGAIPVHDHSPLEVTDAPDGHTMRVS